jgi:hypothetical protein
MRRMLSGITLAYNARISKLVPLRIAIRAVAELDAVREVARTVRSPFYRLNKGMFSLIKALCVRDFSTQLQARQMSAQIGAMRIVDGNALAAERDRRTHEMKIVNFNTALSRPCYVPAQGDFYDMNSEYAP